MENMMKKSLADAIRSFRLPRYSELPDVGLYLEQTTKYINHCLDLLTGIEITGSMIRNYVKMDLVNNPINKKYYADQIAHLIIIALLKNIVPLEHINELFHRQRQVYTDEIAYDYFCDELENLLLFHYGVKTELEEIGITTSIEKKMLRSAIIALVNTIYLNACFEFISVHTAVEPAKNINK